MLYLFEVFGGVFGAVPEPVGVLIAGVSLTAVAVVLRRIASAAGRAVDADATQSPNR